MPERYWKACVRFWARKNTQASKVRANVPAICRISRIEGRTSTLGRNFQMLPILTPQEQGQEIERVEEPPDDEGPVGAMPESAHDENDERIADLHADAAAAAAQGDVEVVAEPGGQRDVPAPPELGDVAGEVGVGEIAHQVEAEQPGGADGDVGVAGEVAVDLEGEEARRPGPACCRGRPPGCRRSH